MLVFAAPFYWLYLRRHYREKKIKVGINRHLELFFSSKYATYLVYFWAVGEALIWFVIPEFLLLLLIFMRIKDKLKLLYADILGTVTGTLIAWVIHVQPEVITRMPYITDNMVAQTQLWYQNHGIFALIYQPFSGVPFKVFTHLASDYHLFVVGYLLFAVLVRISRYAVAYGVLTGMYNTLHTYIYRNYIKLFFIASFVFTLLLLKVVMVYGPGYVLTGVN